MKYLLTLIISLCSISNFFGQNVLDTAKFSSAELFVAKKGYDVQQRLQEIKAIEGKEVTVYEITGKRLKIKNSYTGICEMSTVEGFSDKQKASMIVVKVYQNGVQKSVHFPLTNSSSYRIYLTEKMG